MPEADELERGVVSTIAAKCRRCYNCVRSCPAKAIRVQSGQAWVIAERCIGCGNCIKVCAQNAKQVQPALGAVTGMLAGAAPAVAILAPSYPAAYPGVSAGQVVSAVRALGFSHVMEVGFGAEMVAAEYAELLQHPPDHPVISTPCPALVSYIRKYMPKLVPSLAPIVSPMVAMGRAVKERLVPEALVVFIGPCIAKKAELTDPEVAGAVDAAMTFQELEQMLSGRGIEPGGLDGSCADDPLAQYGALFAVSGGLLKAAAVHADVMDDAIVVVEGASRCITALEALEAGEFSARFLDALLCEGCVAGPAFSADMTPLARRALVTQHVRTLRQHSDNPACALRQVSQVALRRSFPPQTIQQVMPTENEIRDILLQTNKLTPEQELNCGACGYSSCREKAIAVCQGLAEPEMCLPYLIDQLQVNLEKLSRSKDEIERAREVALHARQLAQMGKLATDIAHEISTPLGNIMVFSQLVRDSLAEDDMRREDVATVIAEALHCREVLSSLQGFGSQREPQWEQAQLSDIVNRALAELEPRLREGGVRVETKLAEGLPAILADPAQLTQVLVNILINSLEALGDDGRILVEARLKASGGVELVIADNGRGIDQTMIGQVFQPFITTKRDQPGAGLGLAVAHGIVQRHGGDIAVESKPGAGTKVTVTLPAQSAPTRQAIKVLVVDDDPDFLEQHRIMLTGMGFEVVTAERSDEAIEVANREIPDAFVLDLMMERSDSGARLSRRLRRDPRFAKAPIILLTAVVQDMGFEFNRNPREVLEWMRADAWFDKPAPIAELANTIRRLLTPAEA